MMHPASRRIVCRRTFALATAVAICACTPALSQQVPPVSFSGNLHFDIAPGEPEKSILMCRIESTDPGVMMPELPRRLADEEGNALVREEIRSLHPERLDLKDES